MSADNYILIRKDQNMWIGYLERASSEEPTYTQLVFKVKHIEDAILHAQNSETEYWYRFEGLGEALEKKEFEGISIEEVLEITKEDKWSWSWSSDQTSTND